MKTTDIEQILKELKSQTRLMKKQRKQQQLIKNYEFQKRMESSYGFTLEITYRDSVKYDGRPTQERIKMEDFNSAVELFDTYRKIGFDIKIQTMRLYLGNEKVTGVNFKHKIDG